MLMLLAGPHRIVPELAAPVVLAQAVEAGGVVVACGPLLFPVRGRDTGLVVAVVVVATTHAIQPQDGQIENEPRRKREIRNSSCGFWLLLMLVREV